MANASQSIPAPISYSCWDTFKEWSLQHPNKIVLAIAVIFAIGALVAHYAFSASLGWPVGIGVAGFVAVIIAKAKLNVEKSMGYQLHHKIWEEQKPGEALSLVNPLSVKYQHEGYSLLREAVIRADSNSQQWINLIKAIDQVDPSLKYQTDRTGQTPIASASGEIKAILGEPKSLSINNLRVLQNPNKIALIIAMIFAIGAVVAHYALNAPMGWPIGIGVAGFVSAIAVNWMVKRAATSALWLAINERRIDDAMRLVTPFTAKFDDRTSPLNQVLEIAESEHEKYKGGNPDPKDWLPLICALDDADPSQKNNICFDQQTPLKFIQTCKFEPLRALLTPYGRLLVCWHYLLGSKDSPYSQKMDPKRAMHFLNADVLREIPEGLDMPKENSLLWVAVEIMLQYPHDDMDDWIAFVKKIDSIDPTLKNKTNTQYFYPNSGRKPIDAVKTSDNPKIKNVFA